MGSFSYLIHYSTPIPKRINSKVVRKHLAQKLVKWFVNIWRKMVKVVRKHLELYISPVSRFVFSFLVFLSGKWSVIMFSLKSDGHFGILYSYPNAFAYGS